MSRLLVVDDDTDTLEVLAVVLEDRHDVTIASNGLEALTLLQSRPFDAVVLDLMMPVMDGETLIGRMRGVGIAVPVVLASASVDVSRLAERLGVAHICKPYDVAALEAKLSQLTNGISAAQR